MDNSVYYTTRDTSLGPVTVLWGYTDCGAILRRILLPERWDAITAGDAVPHTCPEMAKILAMIAAYLDGRGGAPSREIVSLEACPAFQRHVLTFCADIPRGKITTYGSIAHRLGCAGGGRAVGQALAANPFPLVIPCHRVIRSDGTLGGFGGGEAMKRRLLKAEGIHLDEQGRVSHPSFFLP